MPSSRLAHVHRDEMVLLGACSPGGAARGQARLPMKRTATVGGIAAAGHDRGEPSEEQKVAGRRLSAKKVSFEQLQRPLLVVWEV